MALLETQKGPCGCRQWTGRQDAAVIVMAHVAAGLSHLHRNGWVHADIKHNVSNLPCDVHPQQRPAFCVCLCSP